MKRKFKILGLVLTLAFAVGAAAASAALAATTFHSSATPVGITANQSAAYVFTTNAGTVTCSSVTFSGTTSAATSATAVLTGHATNCKAFGFINIPVHGNGCTAVINANGTTSAECPAGAAVEITSPGCTTKIGAQHLASGITYTTVGTSPNRHITAHTNISGITYNECGTVRTNGTLKGSATVVSSSGEIWVS